MQSDEESDCELKRQREDILVRLAQLKQEVENILKTVDMNRNEKKTVSACPVVPPQDSLMVSNEKTELVNKLELRDAIKEES